MFGTPCQQISGCDRDGVKGMGRTCDWLFDTQSEAACSAIEETGQEVITLSDEEAKMERENTLLLTICRGVKQQRAAGH